MNHSTKILYLIYKDFCQFGIIWQTGNRCYSNCVSRKFILHMNSGVGFLLNFLKKKIEFFFWSQVFFNFFGTLHLELRFFERNFYWKLSNFSSRMFQIKSNLNIFTTASYDKSNLFNRNLHLDCHRSGWDMLVSTTKF